MFHFLKNENNLKLLSANKLIVFVKNPQAGKVKTRLAKDIGNSEALNIYGLLVKYTKDLVKKLPVKKEVSYSDEIITDDEWENELFSKSKQEGEGLGARMKNAFRTGLEDQKFEKVILIGSDCAELTPEILEEAFMVLNKTDVVIGPALDGGYYLIGMSKFIPALFDGINWSTSQVLDQTIQRIRDNKVSFKKLSMLSDVDELEDWERVKSKLKKS